MAIRKRRDAKRVSGRLNKTVWPSGLRRWLQAPVRKGVGSNPTAVNPIVLVQMQPQTATKAAEDECGVFVIVGVIVIVLILVVVVVVVVVVVIVVVVVD